jgi:guanine deaminase
MGPLHFMRTAIECSRQAMKSGDGGPFGAVIVRSGQAIASGSNEVLATNDPTAHAEIVAIRRAAQVLGRFKLDDCAIYCSCEPCPMCLGAIYWARVAKIYYANTRADAAAIGFDDHFFYDELVRPPEQRHTPMVALGRDEAILVFQDYLKLPQRRPY